MMGTQNRYAGSASRPRSHKQPIQHPSARKTIAKKRPVCSICGKSYSKRANLKAHIRIHTGEKRYGCQICDKRFVWKSSLNFHNRSTHKEHKKNAEPGRANAQKATQQVVNHAANPPFPGAPQTATQASTHYDSARSYVATSTAHRTQAFPRSTLELARNSLGYAQNDIGYPPSAPLYRRGCISTARYEEDNSYDDPNVSLAYPAYKMPGISEDFGKTIDNSEDLEEEKNVSSPHEDMPGHTEPPQGEVYVMGQFHVEEAGLNQVTPSNMSA